MRRFKTIIATVGAGAVAASVALAGCGETSSANSTADREMEASEYQAFYENMANEYKKYVTLGDYRNVEVDKVDRTSETITDEELQEQIDYILSQYAEQKDVTEGGTTQEGDVIVLDYEGTIDGESFDGGSATGSSYTIGSGTFIADLDEGLVGLEANKEYEIEATFPDDYSSEDLAGKDAVFTVTVTSITRTVNPELTDDFVKEHSETFTKQGFGSNPQTVDEFKKGVKEFIQKSAKDENDLTVFDEAMEVILADSATQITGYPEDELNSLINTQVDSDKTTYESYYSTTYGTFGEYLAAMYSSYGITDETSYNTVLREVYEEALKEKMITVIIASENGVTVSADDIYALGNQYAITYYGMNGYDDLVSQYGKVLNCQIGYAIVQQKAANYMAGVVKEKTAAEQAQDAVTEAKDAVTEAVDAVTDAVEEKVEEKTETTATTEE